MTGKAFRHDSRYKTAELEERMIKATQLREAAEKRYEADSPLLTHYRAREADAVMRFRRRVESENP